MVNSKMMLFTLLALATDVFAVKINYTCKYTTGGVGNQGGIDTKAGGTVTAAEEQKIIANINSWSSGKFKAAHATPKRGPQIDLVTVSLVNSVTTKAQCHDPIQEAMQLVNRNKAVTPEPESPGRSGSKSPKKPSSPKLQREYSAPSLYLR